ncbi:MobC family replication-relaxation protein, partial [Citrobacter braakii]|uniref:MobC family replication-relaxation protein n=2 Tax=Citrobacter TaxID=544 RepID=UPI000B49599D
ALWGITMPGLARVVNADDPVFPAYFEPGKLRHWTLEHRLLNQRVRLALEEKGGTGWLNGDRGAFIARYPGVRHRPDGIITLSSGAIIAVETERSLKTRARYITIINSHLAASDAGCWHYAMYVMPDEKTRVSLGRLFGSIRTVMRNSVPVPFDAKNRDMFLFRTIAELEQAPDSHD